MQSKIAVTPEEFVLTIGIMAELTCTTAKIETDNTDGKITNYIAKFRNGDRIFCRPTSNVASYKTFNGRTYQFDIFNIIRKVLSQYE